MRLKFIVIHREFDPYLPRSEVQKVDGLRSKWEALTQLAESVRYHLLSEKRQDHEGEVDKQVKSFGVETIRFRNSFDSEGPLVPGLHPSDAVSRLGKIINFSLSHFYSVVHFKFDS